MVAPIAHIRRVTPAASPCPSALSSAAQSTATAARGSSARDASACGGAEGRSTTANPAPARPLFCAMGT
eukprot:scaffold298498_cov32-Tisochrysis_lutea.AAC.1